MKRHLILIAASVAAVAISCNKNELSEGAAEGRYTEFIATMGDDIKTALDVSTGSVSWAEGDAIKIIWKDTSSVQQTAVSHPLTAAQATVSPVVFKAECKPEGNTYAVYPSTVEADWTGYLEVLIPSVQNGKFSDTQILAAKHMDGKFAFQNVCGFLQFSVPAGVTKVVWSTDGVAFIVGKMNVGFPDGIDVAGMISGTGNTEATVNVEGEGTYYLAVAPGTYPSIYVAMFNGDELVGERQTFNQVDVARAQVKKMGAIPETLLTDKYFVKVEGAGTKDGSSWDNAADMEGLRTFITNEGVNGKKIYMAAGKYVWTGDLTLALAESFSIYGGYPANASGSSLTGRNVKDNETIFDGDGKYRIFVVTKSSVIFDGLVFQNAYKSSTDAGTALIFQTSGSPNQWVNNCIFRNNRHVGGGPGGAMRVNATGATVTVTNSIFENNVVEKNSNNIGDAGAVLISAGTYVSRNNIYRNNVSGAATTESGGGAIRIEGATTSIFDGDLFEGNKATGASSSAIYCKSGAYVVKCNNTNFISNKASHRGCIRAAGTTGKLYLNACTFARDTVASYASALQLNSPAAIHNCVFYQNINTTGTGATNISHSANILFSNSSLRLGGKSSTGIYYNGGVNSIIVNSILYNGGSSADGNAGSVINMVPADKNLTSYGHNIIGMFNASATSPIIGNTANFIAESAEHKDYLYVCKKDLEGNMGWHLDPQWIGAPYYLLKWNEWPAPGKPEGYELSAPARVEAAIDAFDTATSMSVKTWLNELGALSTDRRGIIRSAEEIWPGSYDNSLTVELQ